MSMSVPDFVGAFAAGVREYTPEQGSTLLVALEDLCPLVWTLLGSISVLEETAD